MTKELTGGRMIDPVFTIKNVLFVIIGTIILLFFTSIAATYLTISDFAIDILVSVITGLSIAFGGFRAARYAGMYGLINGAVFGLIYIFIVYIIGTIADRTVSFSVASLMAFLISIGCGAFGGIVGVNTKYKKR